MTGQPHCVLPLGVVVRPGSGKRRLILDARYVNEHVVTPSFKYETLSGLQNVLQPQDYVFTFDLKSGYHHVDMDERYWTYLGFQWENQFYVFTQLPFGLAPACWAFTKVTRELLTLWRSEGMRNTGYLDDSAHMSQDLATAQAMQRSVFNDFERAGFIVNKEKSVAVPSRQFKYLGAVVDTTAGTITVPEEKQVAVMATVNDVLRNHHRCSVRSVASLVGTILSMSYSFGDLSLLMTRRLTMWVNSALAGGHSYRHFLPLNSEAIGELQFWRASFREFDGRKPIWTPSYMYTIKIFTDASGVNEYSNGGWGGWSHTTSRRMAAGRWNMDTRGLSSGYLEMQAAFNVIEAINKDGSLDGQQVLLHTDSQVAFAVMNKWGSIVPNIQDVCMDMFWYCLRHNIKLLSTWIPRELNSFADVLSKRQDACDWMILPTVFRELHTVWGPFSADVFASDENFQFEPFYTFYHTARTHGVNAFAQRWIPTAWCNPPFAVMARVLAHAATCRTKIALIVPFWPGAPWWPNLVENELIFKSFVWDCRVMRKGGEWFLDNQRQRRSVGWHTLALLLDFSDACPHAIFTPPL